MSGFIKQQDLVAHQSNETIHLTAGQNALLDAVTASAAELNILDGATLTVTELNFVDGVTSAIQTQLNSKASSSHTHVEADITDLQAYALSSALTSHTGNTSNPHSVTATQVGLGNCDNTSDVNKPISTATQTALDLKQSIVTATVQTTNATVTNLQTVAIATDTQKVLSIAVRGHEPATNDMFWKVMNLGVKNISGTVSLAGGVATDLGYDAGASAWVVSVTVSSGNVIVQVTGELAKTINWSSTTEVK